MLIILTKVFVIVMFIGIIAILWAGLRTPPDDQMWPDDDYFD